MDRINQIQQFLEETPDDNFLIHALALEYVKAEDDGEAKKWFEKNLDHSPQYIPTYYHLGKLFERCQLENEAIRIYAMGMEVAKGANDQHAYSELRSVYEELTY